MKKSKALAALGVAAALTTALVGCSQKAGTGSSPAATSSAGTSISASMGSSFSGGKAGSAASGTPITIGMINQEGGTVSDPEASAAVQAAFDYINKEQGGVGGHPLKLDLCKVTSSTEEAQQCGQQFLNDSSVDVVLQGGLNVGSEAVHQTIAGKKPTVIAIANPGPDQTAKNAFAVNPSALAALPGTASFAKTKGYKTIAIVVDDNPGDVAIAQVAKQVFGGFGLTSSLVTFPAGSTDLTSAYTAALAKKPAAIAPIIVTTAGCTASAKALQQIGSSVPILASALCATDQIKSNLGDFPKWDFESTTLSLYAPDSTGQVAFYRSVMAKYAGSGAQLGIDAPQSFGAAFMLAKVLNTVGADNLSASTISSAVKAYSGPIILGTPKVKFGSAQGSPTLSGITDRFYFYEGNGKWTSSDWQNVPQ